MLRVSGFLLVLTGSLAAQASPYLPIDHPATPLVEWLMARGDIADPTPMIRPLRRLDIVAAIEAAHLDSNSVAGRVAALLRQQLGDPAEPNWVRVEPAAGLQAFTRARRDLLHPGGSGSVQPFFQATFEGRFGPLVLVSRPEADNRLKRDPDWQGGTIQQTKNQAYRFADAYLSAQSKHLRLMFGQLDRNWGPVGSLGLSIANYGYPRTDLELAVVFDRLQLQLLGTELTPLSANGGADGRRVFLGHRLNAAVTRRLNLAIWETAVLSGGSSAFSSTSFNPLILFSFPLQLGLPDNRNTIIGGDLAWRMPNGVLLEGQAMIDDRWRRKADSATGEGPHPGRYALTAAASGRLGSRPAWRTSVSLVSSLAYRTIDSAQSFVDRGIGIGPNFTDLIRIDAELAVPVAAQWLVAPTAVWLRQGEGRIGAPFPDDQALATTPELFIGTPTTTVGIGGRFAGRHRGVSVTGAFGWYHANRVNPGSAVRRTRFDLRLRTTVATRWSRVLK